MGFVKDQRCEHRDRREVRWLFLEIQVVLYMFSLSSTPIVWTTTASGDTWVAPHFWFGDLALMICHSLPQIPYAYCCLLGRPISCIISAQNYFQLLTLHLSPYLNTDSPFSHGFPSYNLWPSTTAFVAQPSINNFLPRCPQVVFEPLRIPQT